MALATCVQSLDAIACNTKLCLACPSSPTHCHVFLPFTLLPFSNLGVLQPVVEQPISPAEDPYAMQRVSPDRYLVHYHPVTVPL